MMNSSGVSYKSGDRAQPTCVVKPIVSTTTPTPIVEYYTLSKSEVIRRIMQGHKIPMKYAYTRTKLELIKILEKLDAGVPAEHIDALS